MKTFEMLVRVAICFSLLYHMWIYAGQNAANQAIIIKLLGGEG